MSGQFIEKREIGKIEMWEDEKRRDPTLCVNRLLLFLLFGQ